MATATRPHSETTSRTDRKDSREDGIDLDWLAARIDYRRFQECVHCGLCTASCPTYLETGNENDSPRGRIYLMRAVTDGRLALSPEVRSHLDLCLDCRACETACPSGVQYGQLIEPYKIAMSRTGDGSRGPSSLQDLILRHLFPYGNRVRAALAPARLAQKLGLLRAAERTGLTRLLPPTLRRMQAMLPPLTSGTTRWPEVLPAIGARRARVAVFLGCVSDAMFPQTTAATIRVLRRNGCEVVIPRGQVCCGAIHYHSGHESPALDFAARNVGAFPVDDVDAIVVNAAGCGAMLKDYGHLPIGESGEARRRFAAKVRDVSEFLDELGLIPPENSVDATVAYHDACHLAHAQRVRRQPRALLETIPGLRLVPLEESEICCGAAGTYNLTQPEMADRLGQRKADRIEATGARIVATGNVGCILQIGRTLRERGSPIQVMHPIDLLDQAYGGSTEPRAT